MDTVGIEQHRFNLIVIATSQKDVQVEPPEPIGTVKRAALLKFGIPESRANEYRLATSPGNPQTELDDTKTVAECGLHPGSKVYLVKPHTDA